MKQRIAIAQLGCGYWGPNLLRNFSALPDCNVKWVAEPSAARRAYVQEKFPGSNVTDDWEAPLRDSEIQGVVIATSAATHFALVKAALTADKHVFVEKPLAMNSREADELVALSIARQRTLMVGHTFLYNPAVRFLKKLLDRGELGQVHYLYTQRLNLGRVRSDANVWWNLGPHDVSILLYLMNGVLPTSISASGMSFLQEGIEDVAFVTLNWSDQVIAHIHVSWLDPGKIRRATLVGSQKMVVYDDMVDDKIAIYDKGVDKIPTTRMDYDHFDKFQLLHRSGDVWLPHIDFQEPLHLEAVHFLECLKTGKEPLTGPRHARDVVTILELGQRALEAGKRLTMSSPLTKAA